MKRGEVVLVDFPFTSGAGSKVRPALVVQNDRGNAILRDTTVVPITSNVSRVAQVTTQFAIDAASPDWKSSGLRTPSVIKCENIYTFNKSRIVNTIGRLSPATMTAIDDCLKEVLGIPRRSGWRNGRDAVFAASLRRFLPGNHEVEHKAIDHNVFADPCSGADRCWPRSQDRVSDLFSRGRSL